MPVDVSPCEVTTEKEFAVEFEELVNYYLLIGTNFVFRRLKFYILR